MCLGGGGGGDGGAGEMRKQEEERQALVRQSINKINEVFGGPISLMQPKYRTEVIPGSAAPGANTTGGNSWIQSYDPRQPVPAGRLAAASAPQRSVTSRQVLDGYTTVDGGTSPGQFGSQYFDNLRSAYTGYYQPQLDEQFGDARKQLQLSAARRGALDSSSAGDSLADLYRQYEVERSGILGKGEDFVNQQRGTLEDQRQQLVSLANTGIGSEQIANMATQRAGMLTKPPEFSPLADLFQKATATAANSRIAADAGYRPVRPLVFNSGGGKSSGGVTSVR